MGSTTYVTVSTKEYALLQRIVGEAICTVGMIPAMYDKEVRTLRGDLTRHVGRYGQPGESHVRV